MIQDIEPYRLDNAYRNAAPGKDDRALCFRGDGAAVRIEGRRLTYPRVGEAGAVKDWAYAFSVSGQAYFLAPEGEAPDVPGYGFRGLRELWAADLDGNLDLFIAYTGYHLWKWYGASRFCGKCGSRTERAADERAMVCPACGNRIYPRINPAVIVGVTDGDRILITKYKTGFRHNALIAGFTEIGETVEQTVRREVMEEVGLRVKNIRYYKSQPWGSALDILMGFFCEADGDTAIRRDDSELGYAEWVRREDVVLQPSDYSLTNEMMRRFRDGEDMH